LAWKAASDNVNVPIASGRERANIVVAAYQRPVLFKHLPAKWVQFHLPLAFHPGAVKAKVKPSDPSKQRAVSQHPFTPTVTSL
jgi:hypothetical protein